MTRRSIGLLIAIGLGLLLAAGCRSLASYDPAPSDDLGGPDLVADGVVSPDGADDGPVLRDLADDQRVPLVDIAAEGPSSDLPQVDAARDAAQDVSLGDSTISPDLSPPDTAPDLLSTPDAWPHPLHQRCAQAKPISLGAQVVDDTSKATNEYQNLICEGAPGTFSPLGPQLYYRLPTTKDTWYRIELTPTSHTALLYVFTGVCSEATIQKDCTSKGKTGVSSRLGILADERQAIYFKAPGSQITIAVDSASASDSGPFSLRVTSLPSQPINTKCAAAELIPVNAVINGDVGEHLTPDDQSGASCPAPTLLDGPQVYYRVATTSGKAYRVKLDNTSAKELYAVASLAGCGSGALKTACDSPDSKTGRHMIVPRGAAGELVLVPQASGALWVAVDSTEPYHQGAFQLFVEEVTPQPNGRCANPLPIVLSSTMPPTGSVSGTTIGQVNADAGITCNSSPKISRDGPQVFYSFKSKLGRIYDVTLKPQFDAYPYIFRRANCVASALIDQDCEGATGVGIDFGKVDQGSQKTVGFRPASAEAYIIAVDSRRAQDYGAFDLDILERPAPINEVCIDAEPLSFLAANPVTLSATSLGAFNEFASSGTGAMRCGQSSLLIGPQLYYELDAKSGRTYAIELTPQFAAELYIVLKNSCGDVTKMQKDCGQSIGIHRSVAANVKDSFDFAPQLPGKYVIAVDSAAADGGGPFTLKVREK